MTGDSGRLTPESRALPRARRLRRGGKRPGRRVSASGGVGAPGRFVLRAAPGRAGRGGPATG